MGWPVSYIQIVFLHKYDSWCGYIYDSEPWKEVTLEIIFGRAPLVTPWVNWDLDSEVMEIGAIYTRGVVE